MKRIITHINPDLDAILSVWLIKRFLPGWSKARIDFVPAGLTFQGLPVDQDPEILHCDTGGGKYDHHHTDKDFCAATLITKQVFKENEKVNFLQKKAIERMVVIVNEDDHAKFLAWPEATTDRYDFLINQVFGGVVSNLKDDPIKVLEFGMTAMDGIYRIFSEKIEAEGLIESGAKFKTSWGEGIGFLSGNSEVHRLALRMGFAVVVRLRPKSNHLGIYGNWQKGVNFKSVFQELQKADREADWYFHPSGCVILTKSVNHPGAKMTKLKLEEIIKIIKDGKGGGRT